ncbi:large terminase [Nocardioides fonticola]|uniref:Large terminase n=1 Tax=Nocardioides fonticola TaxID=450363 RepID=A0ABP7XK30_9ACTN
MPWAGPTFDGQICSLGYEVVDWLEEYACHGPGDVMGQPLEFYKDPEIEDFIIRAYELDPATGRRKIRRGVLSAPKGRAKSEKAGLIGVAECVGPVRFDGWDANGQPVGRPVVSPFVRCLATEEKQAGNTFQNIAYIMGEWGRDTHPEIYGGITGVRDYQRATALSLPGGGQAVLSTAGAASKDGGKETFLVPDEIHLYTTDELRDMYATALRNTGKRKHAEPWALLTTTACRVGENSVWEVLERRFRRGELGPEWLVFHRQAKGRIDINDREHTLAQLRDVYGVAMDPELGWMVAEDVYSDMHDPTVCRDEAEAARYFLNVSMAGSDAWISKAVHERQGRADEVTFGEPITVGFDGSINNDTTVLRGCRMSDGFLFKLGSWPRPTTAGPDWQVPRGEVLQRIRQVHKEYRVVRGYYDPHEWRSDIETLQGELGEDPVLETPRVIGWPTNRDIAMAAALDRLHTDLTNGEVFHDLDSEASDHYGNAYVWWKGRLRLVRKQNPNSSRKIDVVVGDALALEARADALAAGWTDRPMNLPPVVFSV